MLVGIPRPYYPSMAAPSEIEKLVERFDRNREQYLSPGYNETQLRQEFLNPFFSALGWDIENRQGYAEPYKDVVHEDAIKVGTATKAPDYSFRIGGTRKFFVEAKRPSVHVKEDSDPAFQLRRYAWSAKLPLSLLTDFEELAIYDCRIKPTKHDRASVGRVNYLTFADYIPQWETISSIFSREAVLKGSFDKYAVTLKGKKGTTQVDDAFLKEIESWRDLLAHNIAIRNARLTQRELNFAVQKTIDRIIFLRICEDRGIETYASLQSLVSGERTYTRLCEHFYKADERYNSGLFHFQEEKDRGEDPDSLTVDLQIDDKPLKEIIGNLYYPDCPYEFSVLPADILGQVYEQFLGKVIRLTAGHQAKVEDKPEVKKAGGVYYTPTYIVEYIVKKTVGKLLEGKTPKQIAKIRILDPACGSGSFLIGAYQYLLNWHRDWYVKDDTVKWSTGKIPAIFQAQAGDWRLTTSERKKILVNNLYGVDIDSQAVEVTKLSLLLKVLEGENEQSISQQLKMFHERALPDLDRNIKCGNSLLSPDFAEGQQLSLMIADERMRINAFDWKTEYKEVLSAGGFDAIIGNPPYIRIQTMKEWAPLEVEFYKTEYKSAATGNYDIYVVFVERALNLLNIRGTLGFILPHKFFNAQYGVALRSIISDGRHLAGVIHFGDEQVFAGASTYTCLLFLTKSRNSETSIARVTDLESWRMTGAAKEGSVPTDSIMANEWSFAVGAEAALLGKVNALPVKLENVTDRIFQGIKTSADKIYIVNELDHKGKKIKIFSREKNAEYWVEPDLFHPLVKGGDSRRYCLTRTNRRILFPYGKAVGSETILIPTTIIKEHYPLTWAYLLENKEYLQAREDGKMVGEQWYGYIYPKALDVMSLPKIFTPDIAARAAFSLDEMGDVFFTGGAAGGYGILVRANISREYVLGLLNSRLLEWVIRKTATQMRGGYFSFESRFIRNLPIRTSDLNIAAEMNRHTTMVKLVSEMISMHKQLSTMKTDQERTVIERQINATDKQIDALVYGLYGLTQEEVAIVEGTQERSSGIEATDHSVG